MELKSDFRRIIFDPYMENVDTIGKILNRELFFCEREKYTDLVYYEFETSLILNDVVLGGITGVVEGSLLRIDHMFLSKNLRGKSLGLKLIRSLEKEAKKHEVKQIYLESLDFHNIDFYIKYGFEVFGEILVDKKTNLRRVFLKKSV